MSEEMNNPEVSPEVTSHQRRIEENAALPDVVLTPKAVEMVRKMKAKEGLGTEQGLRIAVTGGGCSGFQYQLNFDAEKEGDRVAKFEDVQCLRRRDFVPLYRGGHAGLRRGAAWRGLQVRQSSRIEDLRMRIVV